MKYIPAILFILLLSCTRQSSSVSEQAMTDDSVQSQDSFDFKIKDGQIGNIRTGELLSEVFKKLKWAKVKRDSVAECEGCNTYIPLFEVTDNNYQSYFVFEPGWESPNRDKLFRIRTSNQRFITDKGIRVGMTVKDLKEKYEIDVIDTGGETGLHALVKGFKGSFGIELPQTNDWWNINKQNMSDTLKIDEIIIL